MNGWFHVGKYKGLSHGYYSWECELVEVALPANSRNLVKEATTTALVFPQVDVGKAAAQVLAKIGAIEIPPNEWFLAGRLMILRKKNLPEI